MKEKVAWYNWLTMMFKEFLAEAEKKPHYEIVNLYECKKTGFMKAVVKLSERHVIEKNISDLVVWTLAIFEMRREIVVAANKMKQSSTEF